MKPGLPQGYVEFETLAHKILLALYEHDKMTHAELREYLDGEPRHLSTILQRLKATGFIYDHGKVSKYDTKLLRSQTVWSLRRRAAPHKYKPASHTERQRHYRQKLRIKVPSAFDFRGQISICQSK
jgi:transcription initiation factor IIE alpha subunit